MILFKVTIIDRKAVAATPVSYEYLEAMNNDMLDRKGAVNWLIILANDEKESIEIANGLIGGIQSALNPE